MSPRTRRTSTRPSNQSRRQQARRQPQRNRRRNRPQRRRTVRFQTPTAYSTRTTTYSFITQRKGNTILVTREIFPISTSPTGLCFSLPLCPTKWSGTRASQLASAFTDQRPLSLTLEWMPSVATTTAGTITFGTVFSGARLPTAPTYFEMSRCLSVTNGGFVTTIWSRAGSRIRLGTNLGRNNYPMYQVDPDDIPLWICAASNDSTPNAGMLCITCQIALKNPINGATALPITAATDVSFTHDDNKSTTIMRAPASAFNRALSVGSEITACFNQSLRNLGGAVITNILSPIVATVSAVANDYLTFTVDNQIASQSAFMQVIGLHSNF